MPFGGPATSIQIGGPVVAGTAGSVLFVGTTGLLAQDNANFNFNDVANTLNVNAMTILAGNLIYNTSAFLIGAGSADGADNQSIVVTGGGTPIGIGTRGAMLQLFGNENGSFPGQVYIDAGNVPGADIFLRVGALVSAVIISAATRSMSLTNKLFPATDAAAGQTVCGLYAGNGAPNNANGADGDYYLRGDGGALTQLYHKVAGAWNGIV